MRNNNAAIIRRITGCTLSSDKKRNFFVVAAIMLTTFMIASVFSIGVSYYESINMREKRMQGSVSHMAFANPTDVQMEKQYRRKLLQYEKRRKDRNSRIWYRKIAVCVGKYCPIQQRRQSFLAE